MLKLHIDDSGRIVRVLCVDHVPNIYMSTSHSEANFCPQHVTAGAWFNICVDMYLHVMMYKLEPNCGAQVSDKLCKMCLYVLLCFMLI